VLVHEPADLAGVASEVRRELGGDHQIDGAAVAFAQIEEPPRRSVREDLVLRVPLERQRDTVRVDASGAELVDQFATIQIERERPDWRGTLTADYARGQSNALLRTSYYGKFHSAPGLCDTCEQEFGGKTLFDVEVGRRFGGVRWALGARNLFDTYPDQNSLDNGYGIFPWAGASPFGYNGRFVYTRAEFVLGR